MYTKNEELKAIKQYEMTLSKARTILIWHVVCGWAVLLFDKARQYI